MNVSQQSGSGELAMPVRLGLVTGTLAAPALRQVAAEIAAQGRFEPCVIELKIQVAALLTVDWIQRKLTLPPGRPLERLILPGYTRGDVSRLAEQFRLPVEKGPRDLYDLPAMLGSADRSRDGYGAYDVEIIAEINHASGMSLDAIVEAAEDLAAAGADVIDIGCDPGTERPAWDAVGEVVRALRQRDLRVSIDSFHGEEIARACAAGAELVLSVSGSNCDAAADWGAEVVVIPDDPHTLGGLDATLATLERQGVRYRIDPVIEPIGFGFAASLGRYLEVRRRYPEAAMMMGIGNLTEMTGVDSAGVNALLMGFCQEQGIRSVLTTQVINWASTSVREIDIARRMMHYAVSRPTVPKHCDDRLVMLRDPRLARRDEAFYSQLAAGLTDRNIRLFADAATETLHAMRGGLHVRGSDPFVLFDQLGVEEPSHAFYLGYELCKAVIAQTLGKNYTQDEPLRFGLLTREETSHYENRKRRPSRGGDR